MAGAQRPKLCLSHVLHVLVHQDISQLGSHLDSFRGDMQFLSKLTSNPILSTLHSLQQSHLQLPPLLSPWRELSSQAQPPVTLHTGTLSLPMSCYSPSPSITSPHHLQSKPARFLHPAKSQLPYRPTLSRLPAVTLARSGLS